MEQDNSASLRDRATAAEPIVSALRDGIPSARGAVASFFRNPETPLSVKFTLGANPAPLIDAFAQYRAQIEAAFETRFWSIVDRDGLAGVPSDMWEALNRISRRFGDE